LTHPLVEVSRHAVRTPRIVLSMIAGNEERVIGRCLASVSPHVDLMVVSVNGRDRTEEIAREHGAHVVREPWRDFGYNRTRAAQAARRHALREFHFDGTNTYLLLVDADMVLRVDDPKFRERLVYPVYCLDQRSGALVYENVRLIRLDHDWRCVGRTHEHWAPFPDVFPIRFDGVWIDDQNDGGEHGRKHERDIELLVKDLEDDPSSVRALFYLAESHYHWAQRAEELKRPEIAIGRFRTASEFYQKRYDAGDWDEERWFSRYKQGLTELHLTRLTGKPGPGIEILLDAYNYRPGRPEVPAEIAKHFRLMGKNALTLLFAKTASSLPPSKDRLFVDESARTAKANEEIAIASYYVGDLEGGLAACDRLAYARERGAGFQDFVLRTAGFYTPPAVKAKHRGIFEIPEEVLEGGRWAPSTPTIVRSGDGFLVGVRLVNYSQERGRWYESRDPDRVIRTKTAVVRLSADFSKQEFLGTQRVGIQNGLWNGWRAHDQIRGLEDQRWCLHQGQIWFTATTFDGHPPRGPRVVLGCLSSDGLDVMHLTDLKYDKATDCEKNWVPRSNKGRLELIYSYDPFVVLEIDLETGQCTERIRTWPPMSAGMWRGGAFDSDNGCGLVHERINHYREENGKVVEDRNVYFHRFFSEEDGQITEASRVFTFDHQGIEYAAGLVPVGDDMLVTYSFEDREARFIVFSPDDAEQLEMKGRTS